ncbi:hypothetical protein BBD46_13900 [Natrialba sp. SSL1]|nr:hypothetical protein BBD46_13900 [Natrialba sp. SSL1]
MSALLVLVVLLSVLKLVLLLLSVLELVGLLLLSVPVVLSIPPIEIESDEAEAADNSAGTDTRNDSLQQF